MQLLPTESVRMLFAQPDVADEVQRGEVAVCVEQGI